MPNNKVFYTVCDVLISSKEKKSMSNNEVHVFYTVCDVWFQGKRKEARLSIKYSTLFVMLWFLAKRTKYV